MLPERVLSNWWRKDGHGLVLADLEEVLEELPPSPDRGHGRVRATASGSECFGRAPGAWGGGRGAADRGGGAALLGARPETDGRCPASHLLTPRWRSSGFSRTFPRSSASRRQVPAPGCLLPLPSECGLMPAQLGGHGRFQYENPDAALLREISGIEPEPLRPPQQPASRCRPCTSSAVPAIARAPPRDSCSTGDQVPAADGRAAVALARLVWKAAVGEEGHHVAVCGAASRRGRAARESGRPSGRSASDQPSWTYTGIFASLKTASTRGAYVSACRYDTAISRNGMPSRAHARHSRAASRTSLSGSGAETSSAV